MAKMNPYLVVQRQDLLMAFDDQHKMRKYAKIEG